MKSVLKGYYSKFMQQVKTPTDNWLRGLDKLYFSNIFNVGFNININVNVNTGHFL